MPFYIHRTLVSKNSVNSHYTAEEQQHMEIKWLAYQWKRNL